MFNCDKRVNSASAMPACRLPRARVTKVIASTPQVTLGRRPNGFLGLSLNDKTILFLEILLDKTVSVG